MIENIYWVRYISTSVFLYFIRHLIVNQKKRRVPNLHQKKRLSKMDWLFLKFNNLQLIWPQLFKKFSQEIYVWCKEFFVRFLLLVPNKSSRWRCNEWVSFANTVPFLGTNSIYNLYPFLLINDAWFWFSPLLCTHYLQRDPSLLYGSKTGNCSRKTPDILHKHLTRIF